MLSVIIPAYNEEDKIAKTIQNVRVSLEGLKNEYEIIVVNDGSTDGTLDILLQTEGIKVLSYPTNKGKGYALRKGMQKAQGQYIGFIDGDGEIPPRFLNEFYDEISQGPWDLILGRKIRWKKSLLRKFYTLGFSLFNRVLFGLNVETQTGIKMFRAQAKELDIQNDGYIFDLEFVLACKERNYRIRELSIMLESTDKPGRIGLIQCFRVIADMVNLKLGRMSCTNPRSYGYYLR